MNTQKYVPMIPEGLKTTDEDVRDEKYGAYTVSMWDSMRGQFFLRIQSAQSKAWGRNRGGDIYRFSTDQKRQDYLNGWKATQDQKVAARKVKLEAKRRAKETFVNPYKVEDILNSSWGYDQTNVEWFEVVALRKTSIQIRRLEEVVKTTGFMNGESYPLPGKFAGEPIWRTIQVSVYGNEISHGVKSPIHGYLYKDNGTLKASVSWYA